MRGCRRDRLPHSLHSYATLCHADLLPAAATAHACPLHAESERTPLVPKKKWFVEQGKDMKKQESIISRNERGRHAFLLVYDVCDKQSWDEVKRLVQLIQKRMYKTPVPIMIVGTKTGQCALPLFRPLKV